MHVWLESTSDILNVYVRFSACFSSYIKFAIFYFKLTNDILLKLITLHLNLILSIDFM